MRRIDHLIVVAWASTAVACATPARVSFDEQHDFARYRTWDWSPVSAYDIDAPGGEEARALHARIAPLIEQELVERGFEPARGGRPDFLVAYRLEIRAQRVESTRVGPVRTLTGSQGISYTVTPMKASSRVYEHGNLVIGFAGPDGRLIWIGQQSRRVFRSFEPYVDSVVASVMKEFPPPSRSGGRGPAHPPVFREEDRLLAAMFPGLGGMQIGLPCDPCEPTE
jgi:hypothetical protein